MTDILSWLEAQTRPEEMPEGLRSVLLRLPPPDDDTLDALLALCRAETREGFARGFRLSYQLFAAACDSRYSS